MFIVSALSAGWSGPLSPCGSTISAMSCGAAPTIPSAPLSPADSELFDESRLFSSHDFNPRSDALTPIPANVALSNLADRVRSMTNAYQFEGSSAYYPPIGSANVGGNFIGSATWSPQSTLINRARGGDSSLVKGGSTYSSYSHLRYPPLVSYHLYFVFSLPKNRKR